MDVTVVRAEIIVLVVSQDGLGSRGGALIPAILDGPLSEDLIVIPVLITDDPPFTVQVELRVGSVVTDSSDASPCLVERGLLGGGTHAVHHLQEYDTMGLAKINILC